MTITKMIDRFVHSNPEIGKDEKQGKEGQETRGKPKPGTSNCHRIIRICTAEWRAKRHHVPPEVGLRDPTTDDRAHAPPPGYATIYTQHLEDGLTLPLPPFVAAVLSHYKIALAQVHPNGALNLVQFIKRCEAVSVVPTDGLFRHFFRLGRVEVFTNKWYVFIPIGKIVFNPTWQAVRGQMYLQVPNREASYLFFKTENSSLQVWNGSPVNMDPPLAEDEMPSAVNVNKLEKSAEFEVYSDSELHEEKEEDEDDEDGITLFELQRRKRLKTQDAVDSRHQTTLEAEECNATENPKTLPVPRLEDMAPEQFASCFQKWLSDSDRLKQDNDRLQKVVEAQEKDLKQKDSTIASLQIQNDLLKSEVSQLQDVVNSNRVEKAKIMAALQNMP